MRQYACRVVDVTNLAVAAVAAVPLLLLLLLLPPLLPPHICCCCCFAPLLALRTLHPLDQQSSNVLAPPPVLTSTYPGTDILPPSMPGHSQAHPHSLARTHALLTLTQRHSGTDTSGTTQSHPHCMLNICPCACITCAWPANSF